ncbi:glycosyltransferase [Jejudonia soesokkakensis]|uniref:Glycosyltransferase n=1 Tax=Jejudonia soesokkakensis TaxID=1323432 RepID=A0ABW2MRB2_9FLAO
MSKKKTILIAPLHWGLGHATRCVPIIQALLANGFKVIVASDGGALLLLRKEFPLLESLELPSYNITYPSKGSNLKWHLLLKLPHIQKTIASEKKIIASLVAKGVIDGIISDNRFGVRSKKVPSVFITHQLNVLSGITTFFSSKIHQNISKKFDECWVPDIEGTNNLSGQLGHPKKVNFPVHYIGILSRMHRSDLKKKYDILVILSGPEPQRTLLEEKIIAELKASKKSILLVQGCMASKQTSARIGNLQVVNFLLTSALEKAINESELIISRSGYTTIMDLAMLEKKAFFIPTPGQYEQEYLAKKLKKQGIAPYCKQENFSEKKLENIYAYTGFKGMHQPNDLAPLFRLFERKRKL